MTSIVAYTIYWSLALAVTMLVVQSLKHHGLGLVVVLFKRKAILAEAANDLFNVGFLLFALGWAGILLPLGGGRPAHPAGGIEFVNFRIGMWLLGITWMYYVRVANLFAVVCRKNPPIHPNPPTQDPTVEPPTQEGASDITPESIARLKEKIEEVRSAGEKLHQQSDAAGS